MEIPLTQGKFAIVGPRDYKYLMQWKWHYHNGYAVRTDRTNGKRTVHMHCVVLERKGFEDFAECDHRNQNRCDNRRSNLRPATHRQNGRNCAKRSDNTSGCIGVYWHGRDKQWRAQIRVAGKVKCLGGFSSKEEAIQVRNEAAKKHYGEFAVLNEV